MKTLPFSAFVFLLLSSILLSTGACTKEITREDFLGTYECAEQSTYSYGGGNGGSMSTYTMSIIAGPSADEIILRNLNNGEFDMPARISGKGIEFTDSGAPDSYVTGHGSLDGNILKLVYDVPEYVYSGAHYGVWHITTTCTRQ